MIMDNLMTMDKRTWKVNRKQKMEATFSADLITEAYSELSQPSMVELLP